MSNVSVVQFAENPNLPESVMTQEYVASLSFGYKDTLQRGRRALSKNIDDLERSLRYDIYEQMALDAQVRSCFGILVAGILGGGMDILPTVKPDDPKYKAALETVDFVERCLYQHLETPFLSEFLPDMLKAIYQGHRIAEKVCYPINESPEKGKLVYKYLKVKPRRQVAFVVDAYLNVHGITTAPRPGQKEAQVIPRGKFVVLTWKPENSDPRGTSDFRVIYEPWWNKQKLRPNWLRFLHQFGTPSLIGKLAEQTAWQQQRDLTTGATILGPDNKPLWVNRAKEMLGELEKFQSNSIIVIPNGAEVDIVEVKGDGKAFLMALSANNSEIAKGLLYQTMATEETGAAGSRSTSNVAADIISVVVEYGISIVERMVYQDILKPLVETNFPEGTPIPKVRLPGANRADFLAWASAIGKLMAVDFFEPDQLEALDSFLGVPRRSTGAVQKRIEAHNRELENAGQTPEIPAPTGGPNGGKPTRTPKARAKAAADQDNQP